MLHVQTAVVNNPTFIELQHKTLKHFMKGEYTFTVFNDAKQFPDFSNFGNTAIHGEIRRVCERLNIPCVDISNPGHAWNQCPANRCADAMNCMLEYQRANPAKYLCIDSDMFLIDQLSATAFDDWDTVVIPQDRSNDTGKSVRYFWNGIYYFNTQTRSNQDLLSWRNNDVEGVWTDVGGAMHYWLSEATTATAGGKNKVKEMPHLWSGQWSFDEFPATLDARWLSFFMTDPRNKDGKFYSELYDGKFLHYRAGGNWEKRSPEEYNACVKSLEDTINSVCR
jgi:hypothetical protein